MDRAKILTAYLSIQKKSLPTLRAPSLGFSKDLLNDPRMYIRKYKLVRESDDSI